MITTSLNITDKLPEGLVELYQVINKHAIELEIPYLVVGATARDIESKRVRVKLSDFNLKSSILNNG
tara:strand:+ start:587 stop:787 length:201 start_codon:yes stop_codon:yes gene_type:complete